MPVIYSNYVADTDKIHTGVENLTKKLCREDRRHKNVDITMQSTAWPMGSLLMHCKDKPLVKEFEHSCVFNFTLATLHRDKFYIRISQTIPTAAIRIKFLHPELDFALIFKLPATFRASSVAVIMREIALFGTSRYKRIMNSAELRDVFVKESMMKGAVAYTEEEKSETKQLWGEDPPKNDDELETLKAETARINASLIAGRIRKKPARVSAEIVSITQALRKRA